MSSLQVDDNYPIHVSLNSLYGQALDKQKSRDYDQRSIISYLPPNNEPMCCALSLLSGNSFQESTPIISSLCICVVVSAPRFLSLRLSHTHKYMFSSPLALKQN
jgi:hypothetical protein